MNIKVRSMTYDELGEYQDYVEGLAEQGMKESKASRMGGAWIMENIYKIDVHKCNLRPGTILKIVSDTVELTLKAEDEAEKN